jgi:ATP-binding cassette subfamily F protein 3
MQIDRMDKVDRPVFERRRMGLELRSGARGGTRVLALEGVDVAFGDEPVLIDVDLEIHRGERVGVVGPNGAGKSVLLRMLAGDLAPRGGAVWRGPSIEIGYLSQAAEAAPGEATVIDALRAGRSMSEEAAVRRLMRFLFDYEQTRRPVASLSGGERTRLALLLLMEDGANCLVLDEPTNHLDIDSLEWLEKYLQDLDAAVVLVAHDRWFLEAVGTSVLELPTNHLDIDSIEVLEDALERYDGTVVAVSHDRYFLDRIADRVVLVRDGEVRAYEGGWSANAAVAAA